MWAYLPLQAYFTCTKDNVSINTLVLQRQRIQISELQIVMHTNAHTCARPPGHYKYQEERHPPRHPCLRGKMGIYNHTLHYMLLASRCKHFMQLNLSKPDVLLPVPLSTLFRSRFQAKPATFLIPINFSFLFAVEELYGTRYQSGSFSLINVGSGFHCLRSFSFFLFLECVDGLCGCH